MKIENNKMVSLIYELRENSQEGRVIEELDEARPLSFIYGTGRLLPEFESNIYSLNAGDLFRFALEAELAYGEKREDMIVDVPISVFETDGKVNEEICQVGIEVPMMDSEGNPLNGIINEITETFVKMDFNHPLAGQDLFFSGRIIDVREPTGKELAEVSHSCAGCGDGNEHSDCSRNCG
jgi:FKBP-type peptidyl-prolyl cis-trans isomerase SlyD